MMIFEDLAKFLYWGCVLTPLLGAIGLFACYGVKAKIKCHIVISLLTVFCTVISSCVTDDFFLPPLWNHDRLTFFLRIMIATGAAFVTLLVRFWHSEHLEKFQNTQYFLLNLIMFQLTVALSLLVIAMNNFFIAAILLFCLVSLLMMACFVNGGEGRIKLGWEYFRFLTFFLLLMIMGVFLLNSSVLPMNAGLSNFGSFMISMGIIMAMGIFPVCIPFLQLIIRLPILLGGISLFIIPLSFFSLFLRLHQINNYHEPDLFITGLMLTGLFFITLKVKQNDFLLLVSPLFISLIILTSIFIPDINAVYCFCLLVISWIIMAPVGYVLFKSQKTDILENWFLLILSGFPPFGLFFIYSVLIPYVMNVFPLMGYAVLGILGLNGYFLFQGRPFVLFSEALFCRNGYIMMGIVAVQTVIVPVLTKQWIEQIALQFIHH